MCEAKLLLAVGALTIGEALEDERAGSLTAFDLIRAIPRYGPHRTRHVLALAWIPERKRIRDLTERQRRALVEQIEGDR